MYTIQLNQTGTHTVNISDENLQTIKKYALFKDLVDSNGYIDESVLDKLKLNIRSIIASQESNCKDLLDLCIDIIYHDKMKAFGLRGLIALFVEWNSKQTETEE